MAKLNVTGMEQTIKSMEKMGQNVGPVVNDMLIAAGEVVAEGWRFSIAQHKHIQTGALFGSIKATPPKTVRGEKTVIVSPTGTDKYNRRKAVRNAEKGFVQNYGRNNMPGSHWADEADEKSASPAIDAMENVWDEFLQSGDAPKSNGIGNTPWMAGGITGAATYHQE